MNMRSLRLGVCLCASSLSACSPQKGDEVDKRVSLFCGALKDDADKMATDYQEGFKAQASGLAEQPTIVKYRLVGLEGRQERGLAMQSAFGLCSGVKRDDPTKISQLRERFSHARQAYVEAPDLPAAAKAASEMAAAVDEVQKLELRRD